MGTGKDELGGGEGRRGGGEGKSGGGEGAGGEGAGGEGRRGGEGWRAVSHSSRMKCLMPLVRSSFSRTCERRGEERRGDDGMSMRTRWEMRWDGRHGMGWDGMGDMGPG
jgi:hypothetical protein